ncbi:hypothetical protein EDB86DRAFT_2911635, partial [Lactarius hatsudake]
FFFWIHRTGVSRRFISAILLQHLCQCIERFCVVSQLYCLTTHPSSEFHRNLQASWHRNLIGIIPDRHARGRVTVMARSR